MRASVAFVRLAALGLLVALFAPAVATSSNKIVRGKSTKNMPLHDIVTVVRAARTLTVGSPAEILAAQADISHADNAFIAARKAQQAAQRIARRRDSTAAQQEAFARAQAATVKAKALLKGAKTRLKVLQKKKPRTTVGTAGQIKNAKVALAQAETAHTTAKEKAAEKLAAARAPDAPKRFKTQAARAAEQLQKRAVKLEFARKKLLALRKRLPVKKPTVQQVPKTCYCKAQAPGESECFFYTTGKYCKMRYCSASYACVGRKASGGQTCFLRVVRSRVVSTGSGLCKDEPVDSFIYVPYAKSEH